MSSFSSGFHHLFYRFMLFPSSGVGGKVEGLEEVEGWTFHRGCPHPTASHPNSLPTYTQLALCQCVLRVYVYACVLQEEFRNKILFKQFCPAVSTTGTFSYFKQFYYKEEILQPYFP